MQDADATEDEQAVLIGKYFGSVCVEAVNMENQCR